MSKKLQGIQGTAVNFLKYFHKKINKNQMKLEDVRFKNKQKKVWSLQQYIWMLNLCGFRNCKTFLSQLLIVITTTYSSGSPRDSLLETNVPPSKKGQCLSWILTLLYFLVPLQGKEEKGNHTQNFKLICSHWLLSLQRLNYALYPLLPTVLICTYSN